MVGGKFYSLVLVENTANFECKNNCVYEEEGNPGSRVCFKEGDLSFECLDVTGTCLAILLSSAKDTAKN